MRSPSSSSWSSTNSDPLSREPWPLIPPETLSRARQGAAMRSHEAGVTSAFSGSRTQHALACSHERSFWASLLALSATRARLP